MSFCNLINPLLGDQQSPLASKQSDGRPRRGTGECGDAGSLPEQGGECWAQSLNAGENLLLKGCASNDRCHRNCRDQEWCAGGRATSAGSQGSKVRAEQTGKPKACNEEGSGATWCCQGQGSTASSGRQSAVAAGWCERLLCVFCTLKICSSWSCPVQPRREIPGSSSNVLSVFAIVAKSNLTLKHFNGEKVQRSLFKMNLPGVTRFLFHVWGIKNSWWHPQVWVGAWCGCPPGRGWQPVQGVRSHQEGSLQGWALIAEKGALFYVSVQGFKNLGEN